jgi:hypothetical protein
MFDKKDDMETIKHYIAGEADAVSAQVEGTPAPTQDAQAEGSSVSLAQAKTPAFTKGPWFTTSKHEVGPRSAHQDQSFGMVIPLCDVYGDNRQADATLIAVSTEMYGELQEIYNSENFDLDRIAVLLAKARGEV